MESTFELLDSRQVAEVIGCHRSKAATLIGRLNKELVAQGYIVANSRKIPKSYLLKRIGGLEYETT